MRVGIISDTHDDMSSVGKAVALLNAEKVSHVIHAGDIISPFTFELFGELGCPLTAIFGNNDGDRILLKEKAGGRIHNQPHFMTFHERRVVVLHEPDLVHAFADSGRFDLVIYGHTHRPEIRRQGDTLIVNPGKVARLHKGESTLAIVDVEKMEAEIIRIE
ncbi:MAG TPA: metallophosphoesterase [Thermodesulfovibrionales bacterium]|nr:metallophosphoesterase [Thermodesulfovibrionales bacterium]